MKRPGPRHQEPGLFDLPLEAPSASQRDREPAATTASASPTRPAPTPAPAALAGKTQLGEAPARPIGLPRPEGRRDAVEPASAGLPARIAAGAADLVALGSAAVAVAAGSRLRGHQGPWPWAPFALFLLAFSFLYAVVPLAFWGQTPGMAWRGLLARSLDGDALSFGQTFRRWLGSVLTVAGAGLPILLIWVGGRSLADRISGSRTIQSTPLAPPGR